MKVFVAGLSKSGKTSRSRHAANSLSVVDYLGVSKLLRAGGGVFPVLTLADGLFNQRRALDVLQSVTFKQPHQLIDGHALIETGEGPFIVPDWFFDQLAPDLIIYVNALPKDILSRRLRTATVHSEAEIAALSLMERSACERIAARQGIHVITLDEPSLDAFAGTLSCYIKDD
ncbi:AAA family ATPase [Tianweitania sediminis]|uniref:AAA family ATPase n=1 Tax=Tianweitania sediminis TaxID=1502156 RepID=A0A8J7ULS5_9HYPH|nr:AAA family ATPase [Tianweitania sediminis]MBP0441059.1 AAA family ATPase [Tianweitania sediminis]